MSVSPSSGVVHGAVLFLVITSVEQQRVLTLCEEVLYHAMDGDTKMQYARPFFPSPLA